jgi:Skp family chaperone for outer membrane proteins
MRIKFIAMALLLTLALAGCLAPKALNIGYIKTDYLLEHWSKYKDLSNKYIKENEDWVKTLPLTKGELTAEESRQKKDREDKWKKQKEALVLEIRTVATKVMLKENLHFIIVNSESNPIIEYGGKEITSQVLELLNNQ